MITKKEDTIQMMRNNEHLKLILENPNADRKITVELPWDADMEDFLNAFYGIMITETWQPETIIENMYDYAAERINNESEDFEDDEELPRWEKREVPHEDGKKEYGNVWTADILGKSDDDKWTVEINPVKEKTDDDYEEE